MVREEKERVKIGDTLYNGIASSGIYALKTRSVAQAKASLGGDLGRSIAQGATFSAGVSLAPVLGGIAVAGATGLLVENGVQVGSKRKRREELGISKKVVEGRKEYMLQKLFDMVVQPEWREENRAAYNEEVGDIISLVKQIPKNDRRSTYMQHILPRLESLDEKYNNLFSSNSKARVDARKKLDAFLVEKGYKRLKIKKSVWNDKKALKAGREKLKMVMTRLVEKGLELERNKI